MSKKKHNPPATETPGGFAWGRFCSVGADPYTWRGWGDVIRELREWCDMGQEEFGAFFNVSKVMLGRYERQQAEPPIPFWVGMARTFGLNLSWVFTGRGCPWVPGFEDTEEMQRFNISLMLDHEGRGIREQLIYGRMTVQQLMAKHPRLAEMLKNTGVSVTDFVKSIQQAERQWQEKTPDQPENPLS